MPENHDKLYGILLDVQKQIGDVKTETGKQTGTIEGIDKKISYTNGKIAQAMKDIQAIQIELSDYPDVRDKAIDTWSFKKGVLMIVAVVVFFAGAIIIGVKAVVKQYLAENNISIKDSGWKN